jgi:hypothetical protein
MKTITAFVVILSAGLMGCASQLRPPGPVAAASFCQTQGSGQAFEQCQQYYARHPGIEPPQPVVVRSESGDLDPHDRAMLIGALLGRMQQQEQFYQRPMPIYQNSTICSSNRSGNFVSTTCN